MYSSGAGMSYTHDSHIAERFGRKMNQFLKYAKMAQPFVHAPLFRSIEKGQQGQCGLDIFYEVQDSDIDRASAFRFKGPEALGVVDLRVLQGIVAFATTQLCKGDVTQLLSDGRDYRKNLSIRGDASRSYVIAARFKLTNLAQALGYSRPGQATLAQIRDSISRLSAVTVDVCKSGAESSYQFLSGFQREIESNDVVVALNPHLTSAVLGKKDFLHLDFEEVCQLKSDATRLIHSRLHWINQGARRAITIETLCAYVYSGIPASDSAMRHRRGTVRKALHELEKLDWQVYEPQPGSFTIRRPNATRRAPRPK